MMLAFACALALSAEPAGKALNTLVFLSGGPGDTKAAEKPLKNLLSMWEKEAALPVGTLDGRYFPQKDPALDYVQSATPSVFMLPVATFLEYEKAWALQAVGQMAVKGSPTERLFVVVKKGGAQNVAALKGKIVTSSLLSDPKLAELIELEDGTALAKVTTLEYERSPLAALRKVRDGAVAAVLLDEPQWLGLEKLPFSTELELLAKSKPLPRPIVAVKTNVDKATAERLRRGLLTLAQNPDAKSTLQQFSVDGIVAPDVASISAARKRAQKK